jgi:3-phenylpropionate/cinnamic acid dioxygenase small subunit
MIADRVAIVADLLYREGRFLDEQDWDSWLALYQRDAVFWVPAWKSGHEPTNDPKREISLMYHDSRAGLEERIMRIRSRKSITAMPLPRTVHSVANINLMDTEPDLTGASATWTVHVVDPCTGREHVHFGRYDVQLRLQSNESWLFQSKRILLVNDRVPTAIDFYQL